MRRLLLPAALVLCPLLGLSADEPAPPRVKPIQPKPVLVRPVPIKIVRPEFHLHVQSKPKFPDAQPGEASTPDERGLEVTFQPEKTAYSSRGPISFKVELKNISEKPFMLYDAESLGRTAKLVFSNQKTAAQWTLKGPKGQKTGTSTKLEPGKTLTYYAVVEWGPRPQPIPLRKRAENGKVKKPADDSKGEETKKDDAASKGDKVAPPRRRPIRPVIVAGPDVPVGTGPCKAMLLLEFSKNPQTQEWKHPHWVGKIATRPVELEIKQSPRPRVRPQPRPIPLPVPRPQKVQPVR